MRKLRVSPFQDEAARCREIPKPAFRSKERALSRALACSREKMGSPGGDYPFGDFAQLFRTRFASRRECRGFAARASPRSFRRRRRIEKRSRSIDDDATGMDIARARGATEIPPAIGNRNRLGRARLDARREGVRCSPRAERRSFARSNWWKRREKTPW